MERALRRTDLLVFTLGLTECWEHRATGTVYPTAPETLAGQYDPKVFGFRNLTYDECIEDFVALRGHLSGLNPDLEFLLTVSPVPLTAMASGQHALTATVHSKSVLRAVCGALYDADPSVDYFPSYELVTWPRPGFTPFQDNERSPTPEAVALVMGCFLRAHGLSLQEATDDAPDPDDPFCEDALLEDFAE